MANIPKTKDFISRNIALPAERPLTLRIILCDDHRLFLEALSAMIDADPGMQVVGKGTNGIEGIALTKKHRPDVAILDLAMPGANGFEAYVEAARWSPETRFIGLTGLASPAMLEQLVAAGIHGLFLKSAQPDALLSAIRDVAAGERRVSPDIEQMIADAGAGSGPVLTAREFEVLQGIARGQSNPQIAEGLGISPKTVDSHRTRLMAKMEVNTTAALLVAAMRAGLIDITP